MKSIETIKKNDFSMNYIFIHNSKKDVNYFVILNNNKTSKRIFRSTFIFPKPLGHAKLFLFIMKLSKSNKFHNVVNVAIIWGT